MASINLKEDYLTDIDLKQEEKYMTMIIRRFCKHKLAVAGLISNNAINSMCYFSANNCWAESL